MCKWSVVDAGLSVLSWYAARLFVPHPHRSVAVGGRFGIMAGLSISRSADEALMLTSHRQSAIRHSPRVVCQVYRQGVGAGITSPVGDPLLYLQPSPVLWPVAVVPRRLV